ncbi:MAG: ABC transporter permease [Candidatus Dormibacteria bacterium]
MNLVGIAPRASGAPATARVVRVRSSILSKIGAAITLVVLWQGVVLTHWRPEKAFPGPVKVLQALATQAGRIDFYRAVGITLGRAAFGYAVALLIGTVVGVSLAVLPVVRSGVGSLLTGLMTMPSIAWFPFAILLFGLDELSILFVVVMGAGPTIAHGVLSGVDSIPRKQVQAARILGAHGVYLYRRVVLPAALPQVLAGLKTGWAFAWRSLLAAELLVMIAGRPSLGVQMQSARQASDAASMISLLIVLLGIGIVVDFGFNRVDRHLRLQRGTARHPL